MARKDPRLTLVRTRVILDLDEQNKGMTLNASRVQRGSVYLVTRLHRDSRHWVYVRRWNKSQHKWNKTEEIRHYQELLPAPADRLDKVGLN